MMGPGDGAGDDGPAMSGPGRQGAAARIRSAPGRSRLAVWSLLLVTALWGSTFVVIKRAVARMPVADFLAWRFVLATAVMMVIRPRALLGLGRQGWWRGSLLGLALGGGYIAQTYGLRYTSAAISGFITGMFVVFTPILGGLLLRHRIGGRTGLAVVAAAAGLAVISLTGHGLGVGLGVGLTLVCAFAYALQLVGLGEWAADHDPFALTTVQLLVVAVLTVVVALPTGGLGPPPDLYVWLAVAFTAVLATSLAFVIQTWAQRLMSATRTAIVLTMEPVFAGLTAFLAGESISWRVPVGGALVIAAMLLVELGR